MRASSVLVFGVAILLCFTVVGTVQTASAQCVLTIEDVNVLMIITTSFGWDYWQAKEQFEAWNVNVTTISNTLSHQVASCVNQEPRPATADILLSEFNFTDLSQYDVLYIPSGGHWSGLVNSQRVLNLISTAHEMGLIVGTTCIGNRVLCRSNNIVNHTKVAYYSQTSMEMRNEGATIINTALVVTDNGIVTGGGGGGPYGGGYTVAPSTEVCAAIIKAVKGISCVNSFEVSPTAWNATSTYEVKVTSIDPSDCLPILNSTDIVSMTAYVYPEGEFELPAKSVTLTDEDTDSIYIGTFDSLEEGAYHIDIQVVMSDDTVEVNSLGPVISYEANNPVDIPILEVSLVVGAAVIVLGAVILLKKKA